MTHSLQQINVIEKNKKKGTLLDMLQSFESQINRIKST